MSKIMMPCSCASCEGWWVTDMLGACLLVCAHAATCCCLWCCRPMVLPLLLVFD